MTNRLIRWALALLAITSVLSVLAGRPPDIWLWSYMAVFAGTTLYAMVNISPELARERFKPSERGADAAWLRWIRLTALAHVVVAGLDMRWRFSYAVHPVLRIVALAGMGLAFVLVFRSMLENQFFSPVVRLQPERGHRVVDTGPYSVVRHPGYAGMIAGVPLGGLALGSWAAFLVACIYSALIIRRVTFEDRYLQIGLTGYSEYSHRVPYRLIPWLW